LIGVSRNRQLYCLPDPDTRDLTSHIHQIIDEGRTLTHVKIVLHPVVAGGPDELSPGGVAITLAESEGKITIAAVAAGSEAERAGLTEGDQLVAIDGVAVTTMAATRARLSGPLAEDVIVKVLRSTGERDVRIVREITKH